MFPMSVSRHNVPFALIHADVWGPAPKVSAQGYKYYVIFVDDFSRFTWIFPIRQKSDVFPLFIDFKTNIEK